MANRPVFLTAKRAPFYRVWQCEFTYNAGLSAAQKKKNVAAVHQKYQLTFPEGKILEISSKSDDALGLSLSAFALTLYVPSLGRSVPVECAYQSSKVFRSGGPFTELLTATAREAKKCEALRSSGPLTSFRFEGVDYPLVPVSAFYNYLYIRALMEHPELADSLVEYDAFTDIEFSPNSSISCQAKAAAIYVSLRRNGLLDCMESFDSFVRLTQDGASV